ncbi:MAG: hypothetical protein UY48_C0048G0001 [Candidatus Gottesmanbacteria bacterium GW2011_GWB1_49_7]|uniref:Uncharacterized protein n=1 Tax=Candidatus Gottesmanbacteria bacterium GW2011_GWB1_49_7 TaxID=1618448 RepID=A0A0G1Y5J3_9BACT|nr:MAG: hypothetical protein UY48_C0048G0001 [Candidatus Gottesmanbacteria bacterium GW2011_GWB1_49_7]
MATKIIEKAPVLYIVNCDCGSLLITDDITSTTIFKHTSQAKRGKGAKKVDHCLKIAGEITIKTPADEAGLVSHIFEILNAQSGVIKVKIVGNLLSDRWKNYLNEEGNRSL